MQYSWIQKLAPGIISANISSRGGELCASYAVKQGYLSKQAAQRDMQRDHKAYLRDISRIKKSTDIRYTLTEYMKFWLDQVCMPYASPPVQGKVFWLIQHIIMPEIQFDVFLPTLAPQHINDLLARRGKKTALSGSLAYELMRSILTDAMHDGLVHGKVVQCIHAIPRPTSKLTLLNHEEIRRLLTAARRHAGYYLEILLAALAGLRASEILGLMYSDFDRKDRPVTVRRQYVRRYEYTVHHGKRYRSSRSYYELADPKTKNACRTVRVPEMIFSELERRKKRNMAYFEQHKGYIREFIDFVCIGEMGHIQSHSGILTALKRFCDEADRPPQDEREQTLIEALPDSPINGLLE